MDSIANIYRKDIDFVELASQDADFAKVLKSNGQLDFSDPTSVQQLTKALLKRDFKLSLTLPPDRLCPPVPNRLNYILWIQDLLDTSSSTYSERYDPNREAIGLDIGTGASCIYPLLGCAQRPKWKFVGTDIDSFSLQFAQSNIEANNLAARIKLHSSTPDRPLLPLDTLGLESIDFAMTNPPFYANAAELASSAALKSRPPASACTGSAGEMVTPGGELAFVTRLIHESARLRARVRWYTAMLGKLSSLAALVPLLRDLRVDNYAVAEFVQGSKTRRWALAWSWRPERPRMAAARGAYGGGIPKGLLPFPCEFVIALPSSGTSFLARITATIHDTLSEFPLQWQWRPALSAGVGFAAKNVWSRSARRKCARKSGKYEDDEDDDDDEMAFGFKIRVWEGPGGADGDAGGERREGGENSAVQVLIRWLKGHDSILFESFCGMVKRKVGG